MNRVELAPRALAQVRLIDGWWRENRLAAPALFAEELANALEQLESGILFGVVHPFPLFEVRRFPLPKSRSRATVASNQLLELSTNQGWIATRERASRVPSQVGRDPSSPFSQTTLASFSAA